MPIKEPQPVSARAEQPCEHRSECLERRLPSGHEQRHDDARGRSSSAQKSGKQRQLERIDAHSTDGHELSHGVRQLEAPTPRADGNITCPRAELHQDGPHFRCSAPCPPSSRRPIHLEETVSRVARRHEHERDEQRLGMGPHPMGPVLWRRCCGPRIERTPTLGGNSRDRRHDVSSHFTKSAPRAHFQPSRRKLRLRAARRSLDE